MVPTKQLTSYIRKYDLLIAVVCLAAHAVYLLVAWFGFGQRGFPLDDSWIYQTYARNLATLGEWAFVPGVPSTGSTSVLWTPILVPGHVLPVNPFWWTQAVGLASLVLMALGAARLFEDVSPRLALSIGLAVAVEWHLVWAASSGMETVLFAGLVVWFWGWFRRHDPASGGHNLREGLLLGLWGGLMMLARPEGLLVLAVAGLYGLLSGGEILSRVKWGAAAGLGFGVILACFFGLNYAISGAVWPNTFYAKQTEYAVLWDTPYVVRFWQQASTSFVGAHVLLLPGIVWGVASAVRKRDWLYVLPLIWVVLHWGLYALRLPVTFQHGRYAIPTIPLLVIYGVEGMSGLIRPKSRNQVIRLGSLAWAGSVVASFPVVMAVLGAPAYGRDVAFINEEMVAAARWIDENTSPDAVVAVHDIGALGYFAPRPLIDLAGLVSPDVVPIMHDPDLLADFIIDGEGDYLIIFPGWNLAYVELVSDERFCKVWSASEQDSYTLRSSELGPMTIYRVDADGNC